MLVCSPDGTGGAGSAQADRQIAGQWFQKEGVMGRKTGAYKFEKRRKELKKQKKREEKLARKLDKAPDELDQVADTVGPNEADDSDDTEEESSVPG